MTHAADCLCGVVQTADCCFQSRCLLKHPYVTEVSSLSGHNLKRCGTGMQYIVEFGLATGSVLLHHLDGDRHCGIRPLAVVTLGRTSSSVQAVFKQILADLS